MFSILIGLGYTALTKQQRHLLKLVDEGDLFEVEEYLKDNPTLDINGIDYQGRSALTIAIENQNEELVEYFISQNNIRFGDALLRAVKEGNLTVVETLVEAQERYSLNKFQLNLPIILFSFPCT